MTSDIPPRSEWQVAALRPGVFFYYQGLWYLALTRPRRPGVHAAVKSSWWLIDAMDVLGGRRNNFRLHALSVPVLEEMPDGFRYKEIDSKIIRRRRRIALWEKEIEKLEMLQRMVSGDITPLNLAKSITATDKESE
jgi:hypothetical protein